MVEKAQSESAPHYKRIEGYPTLVKLTDEMASFLHNGLVRYHALTSEREESMLYTFRAFIAGFFNADYTLQRRETQAKTLYELARVMLARDFEGFTKQLLVLNQREDIKNSRLHETITHAIDKGNACLTDTKIKSSYQKEHSDFVGTFGETQLKMESQVALLAQRDLVYSQQFVEMKGQVKDVVQKLDGVLQENKEHQRQAAKREQEFATREQEFAKREQEFAEMKETFAEIKAFMKQSKNSDESPKDSPSKGNGFFG